MAEPSIAAGFRPEQVAAAIFIAPGAVVVGDVTLMAGVSVWFNAVLRGDSEAIVIGAGSNIQDGVVGHADPGYPLIIGAGVTVGHGAIVHGARIGDDSLIGMGAIALNGAQVGNGCLVGAGALLTGGVVFPDNSLILGSPARVIRPVSDDEREMIKRSAREYQRKARVFAAQER